MIDTDKYEEHNTDDRIWHQYSEGLTSDYTDGRSRADEADAQLVADAPLLLAIVKQVQELAREATDPNGQGGKGGDTMRKIARIVGVIE